MNDQPFSTEQQEYLKGFMAGVSAKRGSARRRRGGGRPQ